MTIELIITIIIAIGGWVFALIEAWKNRQWQKKEVLANRKYDAYSKFLMKMDDMSKDMKSSPKDIILNITSNLFLNVMGGDNAEDAIVKFNTDVIKCMQDSMAPMLTMKQELSSLKLVASPRLITLIDELQALTEDLFNEFQNAMSAASPSDDNCLKDLAKMEHDERYKRFASLYDDITKLMREEIQIK